MKRILFVIVALAAMAMFACQQESSSNNASSSTDTTATAPATGTESTETTATSTTTGTTGSAATTVSKSDQDFMTKAAEGGLMEVDLGQLAAAKATDNDVKGFGNRMVADHGKANDALKQLATNKNVTLPTQPGAEETRTSNELSQKKGKAFDKAYMSDMVKDHTKDVDEFKKASKSVQDPDLKNWVNQTLTVIEGHLKMAKDLDKKVK